ncbi:MAG: hypothetical protein IK016_03405, partial [Lachnospiraceae bacterium]|nr:hypothetical protein [Lachnospiraceae bacterium]
MEEQREQSHLVRNMTVLFSLIALVIAAVIVLRGTGTDHATANLANASGERVNTVNAAPALDAPLTKSQESLQRQEIPALPYEDPTTELTRMTEDIRLADDRLLTELLVAEEAAEESEADVPQAQEETPAAAAQPAPTPA